MTYVLSDIHGQMRRFQSVMKQINLNRRVPSMYCLIPNPRGDMEEGDTMSEENILNDISALIAQFEEQKKMIYSHYIQAVAKVVAGRITAEKEIERIMDGLLDFGDDEKFLALYKKLCRHVYTFYPQMVGKHIAIFRMQFEEKEEKKNGND